MRISQMRKYDSANFIALNGRLEQHSATMLNLHHLFTLFTQKQR